MTNFPTAAIILHRHPLSGHSHRAELFLSLLGLPYTLVDVDVLTAQHKTPAFLDKNLFGQLPVLQDGDDVVADSNAILVYLALKYDDGRWLPRDPFGRAARFWPRRCPLDCDLRRAVSARGGEGSCKGAFHCHAKASVRARVPRRVGRHHR